MEPPTSYTGQLYTITFTSDDFWLTLIAFLFPPIPVIIRTGIFSKDSLLNILLLLLFYFPALLHSFYVVYQTSPARGQDTQQHRDGELSASTRLLDGSDRALLDLEAQPIPFNTEITEPRDDNISGGRGGDGGEDCNHGLPRYEEVGNNSRDNGNGVNFPMDNKLQR